MSEENKNNQPGDSSGKSATTPTVQQLARALEQHEQAEQTIEPMIRERVQAGLTRAQAIDVVKAQIAHDARLAEERKNKAKA